MKLAVFPMACTQSRSWGALPIMIGPAMFLASAAAAFVTGITFPVDGYTAA